MYWKIAAENDLRHYNGLKASLTSIPERIEALTYQKYSIQGSQPDKIPSGGGDSRHDDSILSNIVEIKRLEHLFSANKILVRLIERGLADLFDTEKLVLEKFYIDRKKGYLDDLMKTLEKEKTQIYNIKDRALEKFTHFMYGIEEF